MLLPFTSVLCIILSTLYYKIVALLTKLRQAVVLIVTSTPVTICLGYFIQFVLGLSRLRVVRSRSIYIFSGIDLSKALHTQSSVRSVIQSPIYFPLTSRTYMYVQSSIYYCTIDESG